MKKLVLKAVVITLACIIATAAIVYLVLFAAFPGTLAGFYGNVGNYDLATHYAVKAYDAGGKIDNLVEAGDYAVMSGKDGLIINTVGKLIESDDYADYANNNPDHATFLTAKYVVAKYLTEGGSLALVDKAFELLIGYRTHNQVENLIVSAYDKGDKDTLALISTKLDALDTAGLSETELAVLSNDKALVQNGIN